MFEPKKNKDGTLDYPACHLCGRVLTDEDHTDEAGTDGKVYWDVYLHSPDGLEEIAGVIAYFEDEAERFQLESLERLQKTIDDTVAEAVRQALRERGL